MFPMTLESVRKAAYDNAKVALATQQKLVDWQLGNVKTAMGAFEQGVELAVTAQKDAVEALAPSTDEA